MHTRRPSIVALGIALLLLAAAGDPVGAADQPPPDTVEALKGVGVVDEQATTGAAPPGDVVASLDAGTVVVGDHGAEGIAITVPGVGDVGLGLPSRSPATTLVGDDTVVYDGTSPGTDVAAQATDDGARALVVIDDAGAPLAHRFPVSLPPGASLTERVDGGFDVVVGEEEARAVVAEIEPPWAVDADGRAVPTRYRLEGTVLVQEVHHAGFTYPVVADPKVSAGWFIYVKFSKNETLWIGSARLDSKADFVRAACMPIPNAIAKFACQQIAVNRWRSVGNTFVTAKRQGRCVEFKINYAPQVLVGWKVVGC